MKDSGYTTSQAIWDVLSQRMQAGRWYELADLYSLVERYAGLRDGDFGADAPGSSSLRWQRNVRNVLQRRKTSGYLEWDAPGRYRLI